MKRLILVILASFVAFEATSSLIRNEKRVEKHILFIPAYDLLRSYEGNYSHHPLDRGGETYGGIARKIYPNWYGWKHIDEKKGKNKLPWNTRIEESEHWVLDFYLDLWVKEGWNELRDQELANYLFEFRANGTVAIRIIQRSINECGGNVELNNRMNEEMALAINRIPSERLLRTVRANRAKFYYNIVRRDKGQRVFLSHWLKRTNS